MLPTRVRSTYYVCEPASEKVDEEQIDGEHVYMCVVQQHLRTSNIECNDAYLHASLHAQVFHCLLLFQF